MGLHDWCRSVPIPTGASIPPTDSSVRLYFGTWYQISRKRPTAGCLPVPSLSRRPALHPTRLATYIDSDLRHHAGPHLRLFSSPQYHTVMSSLPKYPTSQFEESEEVKVFDKHIEDAATQAPTTTKPHLSETLAAMPDAPSESILAEAVALAEYEKTAPFWQSLRLDWRIILFCCAYILPAIGQGLDNGVNNIAVNMPAFLIKFGEFNPTTKSLFMPSLWVSLRPVQYEIRR